MYRVYKSTKYPYSRSSSSVFDEAPSSCSDVGNHPHLPKSTLNSPVRPVVTSTPSANRASRWRCAPCVPGPREEIVPAALMTRCQGTGGLVLGERNLRAFKRATSADATRTSGWRRRYLGRHVVSAWACLSASRCVLSARLGSARNP